VIDVLIAQRTTIAMVDEVPSLVQRAQAGDGGAFGALYERFAPEIRRFLLGHLNGHDEIADDLTADVFVKVLQRLGAYQVSGAPFSAWLYRIARNHLIDYVRAQARQRAGPLEGAMDVLAPNGEAILDRSLDRHELTSALAHLTPDQRRAITLRLVEGYSTAETAAMMGKTEDAIKKIQARGLLQLRRIIKQSRRADSRSRRYTAAPVTSGGMLARVGVA
jgi:RNA polymerase sigma-70 factor (ECF subfamily)